MAGEWCSLRWGDLATLEYGRALRGHDTNTGQFRVFGTNGPIGWHNEALCDHPSVIIGRKGAYRGVHFSAEPFFVIDTAFFLEPKREIDLRWAYYELLTQDINSLDSGSAIPSTSRESFYNLPVRVPPLSEQRAIAHILGTLDDKIELNRRMSETLEGIARAIFKSWFVDFDPVRAKMEGRDPGLAPEIAALFPDRLVQTENSKLPEGWRQATFDELARPLTDVVRAEELSSDEPYIGLEHMPRRSITLAEWGSTEELASHKVRFRQGDILFGKLRPYFHKVGYALIDGVCSTDIVVLRPTHEHFGALLLFTASSDAFVAFNDMASTGTRMPRTSWGRMREYGIALPKAEVADAFQRLVEPMLDRIRISVFQSRTLAALRDLLLPKLMSGEIRIKDAEKLLGEAGA